MILRAYKYRLYPNKEQTAYLEQNFGAARFVWNQLVARFESWSACGPNQPPLTEKLLKDDPRFPFLNDAISYALQQKRIDFDETKRQFFNRKRKTKLGHMKFKKKGVSRDSFRIPAASLGGMRAFDLESGRIKLTKMSSMKMVVDRPFTGEPVSVTVSKSPIGQYFVSVLVKEEVKLKQNTGRSVGIDLGLKDMMVLSNNIKVDNPRWFRESQTKLKKAQQHLSRKKKGSNKYSKQKIAVARIHNKIANQRKYTQHCLSLWLVNNFDTIVMENLNVSGIKKSNLGKSVSDTSFSQLVGMIEYKSAWYGRTFHKIDRFFASSKTCNDCGHKLKALELSVREWRCPVCHTHHDRDLNAAKNIKDEGLRDLYSLTSDELADYKRGESVRPAVVLGPMAYSVKRLVHFIDFDKRT